MISRDCPIRLIAASAIGAFFSFATTDSAMATGAQQAADGFQPHKAIYQMTMSSSRSAQRISSVSGEMFFEWADTCDAWTTAQKFRLTTVFVEGGDVNFESDYSSWEAKDGETFSFNSRHLNNGESDEVFRGSAARGNNGGGTVEFSRPETKEMDLPRQFLFPSEHTFELLKAAENGRKFFSSLMFDGTDDEGAILINAVIGSEVPALGDDSDLQEELREPGWSVRMAFFDAEDQESSPNYEMTITLLRNGIVRDLLIDYDDFSLRGDLLTIDLLEESGC